MARIGRGTGDAFRRCVMARNPHSVGSKGARGRSFAGGERARFSRGQVMVFLAVALPTVVGVLALATDLAVFYFNWSELQNAADAAAIAGANYLPTWPSSAASAAQNYAELNGIQPAEITSTQVGASNTTISVTLARSVPYYMARVLGLTAATVRAHATAGVLATGSATGITPIGIDDHVAYTYGQQIVLHQGVGPGNWAALALGGTGASTYEQNLENGYSGSLSTGQWVQTQPGNMSGPTQTGFDYLITQGEAVDPSGSFSSHALNDPRVLTVPIVDFSNINGSSQVPVEGFAEVWVSAADNQGDLTCYFVQQVAGHAAPSQAAVAGNFGSYTVVLLQ
jgi:Flp pilus assembly protein TadG